MIETRNINNDLHSFDNRPSNVSRRGSKVWHEHGKFHRVYGPYMMIIDRFKMWRKNSIMFNERGPAWINDLNEEWQCQYEPIVLSNNLSLNWQDFNYD